MCEIAPPTLPARLRGGSLTISISEADLFARDTGRGKSFLVPLSKVKIEGRLFAAVFVGAESLDVDALL
jgi:hypothetical protein